MKEYLCEYPILYLVSSMTTLLQLGIYVVQIETKLVLGPVA